MRTEAGVTGYVELGPGGVLTGMAKRTVDTARTISVATPDELDKLIERSASLQPPSPPSAGWGQAPPHPTRKPRSWLSEIFD